METKEEDNKWYMYRNNNGEWISEDHVVIVSRIEVGVLKTLAAKQCKPLSVQRGPDDLLWCYKHEISE